MKKILDASSVNRISVREFVLIAALLFVVIGAVFGLARIVSLNTGSHREQRRRQLVTQGHTVFIRERCFYCHTVGGKSLGKDRRYRPWLASYRRKVLLGWSQSAPDLVTQAGPRSDDWQLAHLLDPQAVSDGSAMPASDRLADRDTKALIAFLQRERRLGPPVPRERVSPARIQAMRKSLENYRTGRRIYSRYCAGCHGDYGNGNGRIGHVLDPEPRDFNNTAWMQSKTDAYLFDKITNGKARTAMPVFADILTLRERALVLSYIRYFPDASARQRMEESLPEILKRR